MRQMKTNETNKKKLTLKYTRDIRRKISRAFAFGIHTYITLYS